MIVLCSYGHAQKNKAAIAWENHQSISWKDYKARAPKISSFAALTSATVSFSVEYQDQMVTINIQSFFNPKASWSKDKNNPELLAHELLHFSITELFARQLRRQLTESRFTSREKKLMKELSKLYSEKMKALNKYQKLYDKESNHSLDKKAQAKWIVDVEKQLNELQAYSNSQIILNLQP